MEDSPPEFIIFRKPGPLRGTPYDLALDLVVHVHALLDVTDQTRINIKDQLDRTTTAIAMQLAHVLEEIPSQRWAIYRAAHKLASTCATLLDIIERQGTKSEHLSRARRTCEQLRAQVAPLAHR
jgi:hypothetical protein